MKVEVTKKYQHGKTYVSCELEGVSFSAADPSVEVDAIVYPNSDRTLLMFTEAGDSEQDPVTTDQLLNDFDNLIRQTDVHSDLLGSNYLMILSSTHPSRVTSLHQERHCHLNRHPSLDSESD